MASPGEPRAGGLALALGDALSERGGVWFGWSGETVERKTRGVRHFTEGNVEFALADLTQGEFDGYYLGYANRRLGRYDEALEAYDHALDLKPDYAQAIEYRGHAYLSLNRLAEAKAAYLALFAGNRQLAATLLAAMQAWVGDHRGGTGDVDGATLASFASWVSERSSIASQTAALTREGAASAWHR